MKKKLIVLGDGGHARAVVEVALSTEEFEIKAVVGLDEVNEKSWSKDGIHWEKDSNLRELAEAGTFAIVGLGQIMNPAPRVSAYERLKELGFEMATLISPNAYVSKSASIGMGSVVMHGAVVNAHGRVGENTIINSMALVEHDAVVGTHSHISTGSIVNGGSKVGDRTFLGSGALVKQGITIGSNCVISMGSIVVDDISDGDQASGPGRELQ
jgi:sugar O-acyltransferase (sialic acid O-acetyltransferase NeuD family)